jgi:hypothetical protein
LLFARRFRKLGATNFPGAAEKSFAGVKIKQNIHSNTP